MVVNCNQVFLFPDSQSIANSAFCVRKGKMQTHIHRTFIRFT